MTLLTLPLTRAATLAAAGAGSSHAKIGNRANPQDRTTAPKTPNAEPPALFKAGKS